jgi:hypothetical protein
MTVHAHTPAPSHVRRLVFLGYVVLALALFGFWLQMQWNDQFLTLASLVMLALGVWPMLLWLKRNDMTYPISEFMLLTTVPFYALPLLTGHEELQTYSEDLLLRACLVVIAFQLACIAGSQLGSSGYRPDRRFNRQWWREDLLSESKLHFTAYTALLNTAWLLVSGFTSYIPSDWFGTARAIFFGIGIISIFIQGRLWGAGQLTPAFKVLFWFNLSCQIILLTTSLLLINGMSLLLTAGVGYFSAARRVPWLPVVLLLPLIAVLQNGKSAMRNLYWEQGEPSPGLLGLPTYFGRWFELGLSYQDAQKETKDQALTYSLMRRASLFQIVCIAVDIMPAQSPFLYGASYRVLAPQVVPRFLWPGKPSPQESNQLLAVQLGMQTEEETETTSIGFGMLTEAYANFGYGCAAALGLAFGWLFRRLAISTVECATLSPAGLLRILLLVWCLSAETTLAVWFSSLYQACVAIGIPLLLWKSLFHD